MNLIYRLFLTGSALICASQVYAQQITISPPALPLSVANGGTGGTTSTGSGAVVLAISPTLTTPTIGVATATTVNKVTLTAPATGSTLTIADGKTLTVSNTQTLAGTDGQTMTFPASSTTVAGLGTAQTFTAAQTNSTASAASTPAQYYTGAIYTGGTGTTDFPHVLVQPSTATASTTWNTSGTAIGINAHTGVGNLLDLQVDGASEFSVAASGTTTSAGSLTMGNSRNICWSGRGCLSSNTTGNTQLGVADAASPVAQTVTTQSVVAGTSNTAGVNLTMSAGKGTGTGVGGSYVVQTAPAGGSGTSQNALATALTIDSTGLTTLTPQANAYSLSLTPPTLASGSTGSGINVTQTINDASAVDGSALNIAVTCTTCTATTYPIEMKVGGVSQFNVDTAGNLTVPGITAGFNISAQGSGYLKFGARGIFTSSGAGNLYLGNADAASPVAQTVTAQGSRGGTDTNVAGANLTIQSGLGTGNATGSALTLKTPHAGSTGTAAQTANTQITMGDNTVAMPNLASSSAATTGTVCWTTATGNLTVDTTVACLASDLRTKMNIRPLDFPHGSALDEVMALKPISYTNRPEFDSKHLGRQIGLGAQDVIKIDPRLVSLYGAGPDEGTPSGVRYMQMVALLVKATQEQQAEIKQLRAEVKRLGHH